LNQSKHSDELIKSNPKISNFNSFGFEENEQIEQELKKEKLLKENLLNNITNNSDSKTTADINYSNKSSLLKMSDISTNNKSETILINNNVIDSDKNNQHSNNTIPRKDVILNYD